MHVAQRLPPRGRRRGHRPGRGSRAVSRGVAGRGHFHVARHPQCEVPARSAAVRRFSVRLAPKPRISTKPSRKAKARAMPLGATAALAARARCSGALRGDRTSSEPARIRVPRAARVVVVMAFTSFAIRRRWTSNAAGVSTPLQPAGSAPPSCAQSVSSATRAIASTSSSGRPSALQLHRRRSFKCCVFMSSCCPPGTAAVQHLKQHAREA